MHRYGSHNFQTKNYLYSSKKDDESFGSRTVQDNGDVVDISDGHQ